MLFSKKLKKKITKKCGPHTHVDIMQRKKSVNDYKYKTRNVWCAWETWELRVRPWLLVSEIQSFRISDHYTIKKEKKRKRQSHIDKV